MPSTIGLVAMAALLGCVGCDAMTVVHNATTNFTHTATNGIPIWYVNGTTVFNGYGYKQSIDTDNGLLTAILTVNGNRTCDTLNIHCEVSIGRQQFLIVYNTTLKFQESKNVWSCTDRLPSSENLHINEAVNSLTWDPPYSAMNNKSGIIHVDPHITQYTVHITDIYSGSVIRQNVTETQYTSNTDDSVCPTYQVSAWNVGGEGELSEPVQESTSRVPRKVVAGSVTVRATVTPYVLHIYVSDVDVVCINRLPKYFLITISSDERVLNETRQHEPGQAVADFTISLPQSVDVCSLHVRISAGNSAGMSAPSEAVEVVCSGGNTDSTTFTTTTTTTTTITTTTNTTTQSGSSGHNTTIIVVLVGLIAAIGGVCIAAATIVIVYCRRHKKDKLEKREIEMKPNQAYETVTRAQPKTEVHTKPCPAYEVVAHAHH